MKNLSKLALGLLLGGSLAGSAQAQIITLSFDLNSTDNLSTTTTYGAGAGATTGWYNASQGANSGTGLLDVTDTATTADWAFTASGGGTLAKNGGLSYNYGAQNIGGATVAANGIYAGDNYVQNETLELNLTNIPYASYAIYVYANTNSGTVGIGDYAGSTQQGSTLYIKEPGTSTIAGGYQLGTSTTLGSPTSPSNYVLFSGLSGATQSIDLAAETQFAFLNGVEIVDTAGVTAPEPSTFALMAAGLGLLFWAFRRRLIGLGVK